MTTPTTPSTAPDPAAVDKRFATVWLAEALALLGVAQDESTAQGLLDMALDVTRVRTNAAGEVIVVRFPVIPKQPQLDVS